MHSSSVLIVDDVIEIRSILRQMLRKIGIPEVNDCHSARKALTMVAQNRYDYIFLDIELPDHNGIDLLPSLKELNPEAKFIICSGHCHEDNVKKAIKAGAQGFVAKPFNMAKINTCLQRFKEPRAISIY